MHLDKNKIIFLELVIILVSLISFPYVAGQGIHQSESPGLEFLITIIDNFFEPLFPLASAQFTGCCAEANNGASCVITSQDECSSNFAPGATCNNVNFCKLGCCYDSETGIYDQNVLQSKCNADWDQDPSCNLPGAELGCCVLGESTRFETEGQCKVHTQQFALNEEFEIDFRTGMDEISCILLAGEQDVGACVFENKDCVFGTESDCYSLSGEFHQDLLCTASELETVCEMTEETTCVSGKDGVYFKDSCGNIANIYDSTKAQDSEYWRKVFEPEDSCGAGGSNANSASCGNCDRFKGGICNSAAEDDFDVNVGEYYCRDTSCNYDGKTYKNGEAWCEYEGPINDGDDVPGSRHYRYICNAGEVQVEPCADFRNEICIEQNTVSTSASSITGSTEFSNAYCRKNNAKHCIEIGETSMEACRDEPDCTVKSVNVGGSFDFERCVPQYPEGFSFESEYQATGSQVCALNTKTCVVKFQSVLFSCICVDNCGCLNSGSFNDQMDEVCTSLGDCGESSNWNEVSWNGEVAEYDSRVEKYMLAAGLGPDDFLGVGSSLFEQSAFAGSYFAPKVDSNKDKEVDDEDKNQKIAGVLAALGGLLAGLAGILQSTVLTFAGIALSLFGALLALFGGTCPPKMVDYNCNLWEPPVGNNNCDACNNDPDKPCTQYRCNTLGAACEFINEGTSDELCVAGSDDGSFPIINKILNIDEIIESQNLYDYPELLSFIQNVTYKQVTDNNIQITNKNGGCLEAYSPIPIAFNTQEPSQCKFDLEEKDFEDMDYFVGYNTYTYNHSTFFQLPDPSHGQSQGIEISGETKIYVKCRDRFGHQMPEYLLIEMCVNEGPDETPPRIVTTNVKDGDYVSFDSGKIDFNLITNELSTCKWDYSISKSYDEMANEFLCNDTYLTPSSTLGYFCSVELPINSTKGSLENKFYVRCSDQPWLIGTTNEGDRNYNVEPYEYTFYRPTEKINIKSIKPSGEIVTTADKLTLNLEVETNGGALNHTCSYSFSGYDTMIDFYDTGFSGIHLQTVELDPGKYDLYVNCVDETGDFVEGLSSFRVLKKSNSPIISRVYQQQNNLYFVTQEEADCKYSEESCNFDFEEALGVSGDGILHRIQAIKGKKYFIKCMDELGNVPSSCSIVLRAV